MSTTTRGYRFLEHTTDLEVEAYGRNLDEAFEEAGRAIEDAMVDVRTITPMKERQIHNREKDLEALLYSWLESLIFLEDTESLLFSKFECRVSKEEKEERLDQVWKLDASIWGERFDPNRHEEKTAIKAPTYHDMRIITEENMRVTMRFLVDL